MTRNAQQRCEAILEQVLSRGHVGVHELAEELAVSQATVRRDLRALSDRGQVDLVYGGATVRRPSDHSIQSRTQRNIDAKRIVGHLAAKLVQDYELLFVDSGTTCFEMRHDLMRRKGLSVILNSNRLAAELGANPGISIIVVGGHYRPDRMDTVGPLAANAIDQLRGYVAFIGADGVSMDFGVSANEIQTAYLYQHVIKNARETILLVDHTKFETPSLFRIADMDVVSRIVTDQPPSQPWREYLDAKGIELIYPKESE